MCICACVRVRARVCVCVCVCEVASQESQKRERREKGGKERREKGKGRKKERKKERKRLAVSRHPPRRHPQSSWASTICRHHHLTPLYVSVRVERINVDLHSSILFLFLSSSSSSSLCKSSLSLLPGLCRLRPGPYLLHLGCGVDALQPLGGMQIQRYWQWM